MSEKYHFYLFFEWSISMFSSNWGVIFAHCIGFKNRLELMYSSFSCLHKSMWRLMDLWRPHIGVGFESNDLYYLLNSSTMCPTTYSPLTIHAQLCLPSLPKFKGWSFQIENWCIHTCLGWKTLVNDLNTPTTVNCRWRKEPAAVNCRGKNR